MDCSFGYTTPCFVSRRLLAQALLWYCLCVPEQPLLGCLLAPRSERGQISLDNRSVTWLASATPFGLAKGGLAFRPLRVAEVLACESLTENDVGREKSALVTVLVPLTALAHDAASDLRRPNLVTAGPSGASFESTPPP